jgi:uncharacterized glyoxalase superfamily protein PhnB
MSGSTHHPDVVPMLSYADVAAAMQWLVDAFGLTERLRLVGDDGTVGHGELAAGDGVVMLGTPSPAYEGPKAHRDHCAAAAEWSRPPHVVDGVLVYVTDVDAHPDHAEARGATIVREPFDEPPGRLYVAEDLEGHRWMFIERSPAGSRTGG